eukprot:1573514-Rhodomonas_salina.1
MQYKRRNRRPQFKFAQLLPKLGSLRTAKDRDLAEKCCVEPGPVGPQPEPRLRLPGAQAASATSKMFKFKLPLRVR